MILFVYLEYKSNKCETKTFLCNAYFLPKNLVGTNKGQSGPIRDSWCFLKKISVPYCPAGLYSFRINFRVRVSVRLVKVPCRGSGSMLNIIKNCV